MATYKVIQDIEAEDKFVGPLTIKQFIFAGIAAVSAYLSFIAVTKHFTFVLFATLPVILFTGFLAWPWSRDQPTEVWALAKLRFMFKPRRRIWNQTGVQELVTITAPKHEEKVMTNGLSSDEVKSRLKALANTIDSRGWAVKNVNVNLYAPPTSTEAVEDSDRLLNVDSIAPAQVPSVDIRADEDMLDASNNPTAQHLSQLMDKYDKSHRQAIVNRVVSVGKKIRGGKEEEEVRPNYWFMHQSSPQDVPKGMATFNDAPLVQGSGNDPGSDDAQLLATAHRQADQQKPKHSLLNKPLENGSLPSVSPVTPPADPAILDLATNDDLNVATIARQANKNQRGKQTGDDEVVISLR